MSTSVGAAVLLLLLLLPRVSSLLNPSSSTMAAAAEENPMQRLSRAELVRLAGYGEERLSTVIVAGSLSCEAYMNLATSHVQGAKVAVACKTGEGRRINCAYGTTDEFGDFIINLPSQFHAIPKLEDSCIVRVLRMPKGSPGCFQMSRLNPRRIKLSSVGDDIRIYTA